MSQLTNRKRTVQYEQLLNGLQKDDPRLYDVLRLVTNDIKELKDVVDPLQDAVQRIGIDSNLRPLSPVEFTCTVGPQTLNFHWEAYGKDTKAVFFELRKGATWDTATFIIRTSSLNANIVPEPGTPQTFWLKTLSTTLVECLTPVQLDVVVDFPQAPTVTAQVIDNNVLLYWTEPSSDFYVDFYNIYKDNVKFAEISGTFLAKFETVSGTYTYAVEAVDIAGNVGSKGYVSATVKQPPDYVLVDSRTSTFSGTKVNCYIENEKLVACVDLTETFEAHFTSQSWTSPQSQVTAGFERYIQENLLTGSYTEDYDYGVTLSGCIVNYSYLKEVFTGTSDVAVTVQTYYKVNAGDAWTGPLAGQSVFIPSFRYLRTVLSFSAANSDSMIAVSALKINLEVKSEVDSGSVNALASDTTGTTVTFNKAFKDISSIDCTTKSASPITVIIDFVDVPNPTTFKVLCYDSAGRRVDQLVYWIARGIV